MSNETLSPPERQVNLHHITQAISKLLQDPEEGPKVKDLLTKKSDFIVWLDSKAEHILYIASKVDYEAMMATLPERQISP